MATWTGNPRSTISTTAASSIQNSIGGNDYLEPTVNDKPYFLNGGDGNDQLFGFEFDDTLSGERRQ